MGNPHITRTSGEYMAHNGIRTFACAGAPRLGSRLRARHPPRCPMALACCSRLGVTRQWSRALHGSDHVLPMLHCTPSLYRCRRVHSSLQMPSESGQGKPAAPFTISSCACLTHSLPTEKFVRRWRCRVAEDRARDVLLEREPWRPLQQEPRETQRGALRTLYLVRAHTPPGRVCSTVDAARVAVQSGVAPAARVRAADQERDRHSLQQAA